MIAKSHHWQKTAIAAAATALLTLTTTGAMALSLGRITVQSALGEPLRAEIEVPDINAEEAASLRTAVALPDAFTAAGLEYNAALSSLQATLQRRADGRAYIRLAGDRPINDPFVDMILEASWSSGRIVRDYTMLFDPPSLRKPAAVAPTLPQVAAPLVSRPIAPAPSVQVSPEVNRTPSPASNAQAPAPKPAPAPTNQGDKKVVVQPGDTATKIAANVRESGVSLDQMLVAMLRGNPDAFINNNIDRIRSGAVINVPSAEQAKSVAAPEATRILRAESKDFGSFKRALASNAPTTAVAAADRKTSGTIESKVVESKPKAATPDKLTLSKGAIQAKNEEAKLAKERADKDAAARAAELAKNISDLKKAGAAVTAASAPAATAPVAKPAVVPAPTVVTATPASAPAAVTATPPAPVVQASAPVMAASAPAKAPVAPVVSVEEPGLVDQLLENPILPIGGLVVLGLVGGFGFYRMRQNKKNAAQVDSSFLESRLQPDSFFGASGGQRVDTNSDGPVSGSSMVYSASQLDAADDVDPVAEADVYLAYGRDLQAEEILKEAVRTNPGRLAIYTKLLEIFAKRRDANSFEATATQAYKLTGSESPDWGRICEMGIGIDPANPLYQPGGAPSGNAASSFTSTASTSSYGASTVPHSAQPELAQGNGVDLDLDLDFSLDDEPASAISDVTGGTMSAAPAPVSLGEQTLKMDAPSSSGLDALDFDMSGPTPIEATPELPEVSLPMDGLSLDMPTGPSTPEFSATNTMPVEPSKLSDPLQDSGMLEFDMGSLSLDLEPSTASDALTAAPDTSGEDPLETKLALAEEFVSIGDDDGARALIEEVVAEATGDMRVKAQRALANLS